MTPIFYVFPEFPLMGLPNPSHMVKLQTKYHLITPPPAISIQYSVVWCPCLYVIHSQFCGMSENDHIHDIQELSFIKSAEWF